MPISPRGTAGWFLLAVLAGAAVIWFLPVEISPTVHLPAKLVAGAEWRIERSGQGVLTARLENRLEGVSNQYLVQSIDRGDVAEFSLEPGIRAGARVAAGDTVASLRSTATDTRFAELQGLVSVTAAELDALAQGEKETLIEEARTRLSQIRTLIPIQERIVERARELTGSRAVAQEEFDRALAELLTLRGEAAVTEAQIAVLESGAREADRALAARRLEAARSQLEALGAQRRALVVSSPVTGVVTLPPGDSVLVRVVDLSRWVIVIPVPVEDRSAFVVGQDVVLDRDGSTARILHVDPAVHTVGGRAVLVSVAELSDPPEERLDGMNVYVRARREPMRLRAWFLEETRSLFRWQNWFGHAERV